MYIVVDMAITAFGNVGKYMGDDDNQQQEKKKKLVLSDIAVFWLIKNEVKRGRVNSGACEHTFIVW